MDGKKLRVSEYKALMKNRREEMRQLWCGDGEPEAGQLSPPFLHDSRHNLSLSPPLPHRSPGRYWILVREQKINASLRIRIFANTHFVQPESSSP